MAIDVGGACTDRTGAIGATYTLVDQDNPANASGTIDTICVCANTDMSGMEFAAFADEGGNTLSTNGDTNGSNLSALAASCEPGTTFTSAGSDFTAFAVAIGEYMGMYWTGGNVERSTSGNVGLWHTQNVDNIPAASVGFDGPVGGDGMSVYGTGVEGNGGLSIPVAMHHYQFNLGK